MGLNFNLLSILRKLPADDNLALDHRLLPGGAAASAGSGRRRRGRTCGQTFGWRLVSRQSARRAELEEGRARGIRQPWRLLSNGMMQGGWGAQGMARGPLIPACGARAHRVIFAAFARFGASCAVIFALFRVPPRSQKSV